MTPVAFTGIEALDVKGAAFRRRDLTDERLRESVFGILEGSVLCSIATVTPEGGAHINTAYFSYSDRLDLYFLSHPGSLHCRNVASNPSMAVTVFSTRQQWTDPGQGLQLFGTCRQAEGAAAEAAELSYGRRFPAYESWKAGLPEQDLGRQYAFYRFEVATLKALDESTLGDAVFVRASVVR